MAPKVDIVHDEKLALGEGPHWDHEAKVLYYVDIFESTVLKYDPSTGRITHVIVDKKNKTVVTWVIPIAGSADKFIITYGKNIAILTWDGVSTEPTDLEILVEVEHETENRFNDGKADPSGRLWGGTMAEYVPGQPEQRKGALYSLNKDGKSVKTHFGNVGISNGLAWSADRKYFYYIDSYNRTVDGFDFDIVTGDILCFEFQRRINVCQSLKQLLNRNMAPKIEIVHDLKLTLGETPHWDHEAKVLYYVDLFESAILKYDPSTTRITRVVLDKQDKTTVSFVIPVAGVKDKFVIGYGKKLAILTWDGISTDPTSIEILVDVDSGADVKFNDGKADPQGRLWAGTMRSKHQPGGPELRIGTLYSIDGCKKSAEAHVTDVGISNGLAWSSDCKTFYYVDTSNLAIDAFDYDIDSGKLTNRRTIFDTVKNNVEGGPDGMTIDIEDKLWLATFGGSAIHRIDPKTGSLLQSVKLPASKITSAAWGGPNLDELYVTSASIAETEENPYSGRLFKITGLGTSGLPGVPVKL